jgi:hypothetical protein
MKTDRSDGPVNIRILQPIERPGESGETMIFRPGDLEEGVYLDEYGSAVINWG